VANEANGKKRPSDPSRHLIIHYLEEDNTQVGGRMANRLQGAPVAQLLRLLPLLVALSSWSAVDAAHETGGTFEPTTAAERATFEPTAEPTSEPTAVPTSEPTLERATTDNDAKSSSVPLPPEYAASPLLSSCNRPPAWADEDLFWSDLSPDQRQAALYLGYTASAWDADDETTIKQLYSTVSWTDLSPDQRLAYAYLGYNSGSYEHFYSSYDFDELPPSVQEAAAAVGYTRPIWDGCSAEVCVRGVDDKYWSKLKRLDRTNLRVLGYGCWTWNNYEPPPAVPTAEPTDEPTAAPTVELTAEPTVELTAEPTGTDIVPEQSLVFSAPAAATATVDTLSELLPEEYRFPYPAAVGVDSVAQETGTRGLRRKRGVDAAATANHAW